MTTTVGAVRGPNRVGACGLATVCAALALFAAGCSSSDSTLATPAIPSFPGPGAGPVTSTPAPRSTLIPTDCSQILSKDDVPNLLGLPLGTVDVRGLRDVPAPSVGRLERVTCTYTSTGGPGAPGGGTPVLKILASGYSTPQQAQSQAAVTERIEQNAGVTGVPTPIGAASGAFYSDPDGPLLVVAYRQVTASLTLDRGGTLSPDQSRSLLVDLAQRILPVLVPAGS